ncbi:MAG: hypothetical protein JWL76_2458, partial [Thermoleophilia bacterium]|nr:hypothetical protein [Thermoleophilia bacterium]
TDRTEDLLAAAEIQLVTARTLGRRYRELEMLRRSATLDRLGWQERYGQSKAAADAMLAWLDGWPTAERGLNHRLGTADALNARGDARYYLHDAQGALADYSRADALLAAAERRFPPTAAILSRRMLSGYNIATTLDGLGRDKEMIPVVLALVDRGAKAVELEADDDALRRRYFVSRELAAQSLAAVGRYREAVEQQAPLVAERTRIWRRQPREPQPMRDLAFSRSVLGTLFWYRGMRGEACREWGTAEAMLAPLERSGRLNEYDRTRNLGYIRYNLEICGGRRPASAFRPPN